MDLLILLVALIWFPLIPLRILLHAFVPFWRRLKNSSVWIIAFYFLLMDLYLYQKSPLFLDWLFPPIPFAMPVGIALVVLALIFHLWTIQTLGLGTLFLRPEMSPGKIKVSLVATGPYQWARHPFYLVDWWMLLGLTLITSSWLVLILLAGSIITIPFVTLLEERELVERFGESYQRYQQVVPRLIPNFKRGLKEPVV